MSAPLQSRAPLLPERQLGHFDAAAREYVITTPATPLPWLNYLGSKSFHSLLSNTCGGYSFYRDAKLCEIGEGTSEVQRMVIARELFR